jgi:hypothetical protein
VLNPVVNLAVAAVVLKPPMAAKVLTRTLILSRNKAHGRNGGVLKVRPIRATEPGRRDRCKSTCSREGIAALRQNNFEARLLLLIGKRANSEHSNAKKGCWPRANSSPFPSCGPRNARSRRKGFNFFSDQTYTA